MNTDRAAELIAWTIRSRLERYGIRFLPVDTLDIENLAEEIAATLRDPPVQFRDIGATEYTRLGHYLSTYCLHDEHGACRLTCKTCEAPCRCACHESPTGGRTDDGTRDSVGGPDGGGGRSVGSASGKPVSLTRHETPDTGGDARGT